MEKYFINKNRTLAIKAYEEAGQYVLEICNLIPKYRRGYHINKRAVMFYNKEKANNYFRKVRQEQTTLHATECCIMANGHVFL